MVRPHMCAASQGTPIWDSQQCCANAGLHSEFSVPAHLQQSGGGQHMWMMRSIIIIIVIVILIITIIITRTWQG